ncbi:translocation/assembly module TamB domain-containing protein [Saccharicrinis sp. GN24d3]|uniref:translocation/assembly module TamB domain-containing protein n=1 Tax=Saccharicrinis sp. GN24d3 TaxID=3458416 RepID=UPI004036722C
MCLFKTFFTYFCKLKDKAIKNSYKILFYSILALIISPILLYFVVLLPGVQNSIGHVLTQRLSEDLGTEVSIGNIRFYPIKKLVLNEVLVKDGQQDSLLYLDKLIAPIDSIVFADRQVYLGSISINKLKTDITSDSAGNNYSFIIDSLLKTKVKKSSWNYNINGIHLKNSAISFTKKTSHTPRSKFNANRLQISPFNLLVDRIKIKDENFSFRIKNFSAQEKSGLVIKEANGNFKISPKGLDLSNFVLVAKQSFINLKKFSIQYDSTYQQQDFLTKAPIDIQVNSLSADYRDLEILFPNFPILQEKISLKGSFEGTIADLKGRNIIINAGHRTKLQTHFDITGLPNFRDSYLFLNVKKLSTNVRDISKLFSLRDNSTSIKLPDSFGEMGDIEYSGKFSGFIDNLVAYGKFNTSLGTINTDIGLKITDDDKLVYSGFINTESFNIGKILNSESNLNKVSMDVSVQGYKAGKNEFNSFIKGTIDSIDIKGYKYEKIELNGLISNNKFDGKVRLNDPNAQLLFNGKVDFSSTIPQFNFSASLSNVRLDKLNLAPELINSKIDLRLDSKLSGKNIDSLSGDILFHSGKIFLNHEEHTMDSLVIVSKQDQLPKKITVNSALLDAELSGNFNISSIPKAIRQVLSQYLPSVFTHSERIKYPDQFAFAIKTKELSSLLEAFTQKIRISDGSEIIGSVDGYHNQLELTGDFGEIKYNSVIAKKLSLDLKTGTDKLNTQVSSELLGIENLLPLHNFNATQYVNNDSINLNINWDDRLEKASRGNIRTRTRIRKTKEGTTYTKIDLLPSTITVRDSIWQVQESEISLTPTGIRVNTFRVHHHNQEINVNGSIYKDKEGTLVTFIQNMDLNNLTSLFNIKNLTFNGTLDGWIRLKNDLTQPIITSSLSLDGFKINEEDIGRLTVESNWNNLQKAVIVNALIEKNHIKSLKGTGYFKPSNKDFNFNFSLDSLPLSFINLYTSKVIQNLKGTGSGNMKLLKTDYGLGLEGGVHVNKARFDVDLLKCSFNIEDSVIFTPERIHFKNMTVTDPKGKKGKFNGNIDHRNFRNMNIDLYVHANNMLLLNTKNKDNPLYYGTVYATGDMAIKGTTYDIKLNLNGKTQRNTKFYIPISDDEESLDNNFIRFVSPKNTNSIVSIKKEEEYKVDLSNFTLNMGVEITPDAQVQVIFDPTVGNVLKSWGKGNLQIQMNKEGKVSFLGEYKAEKGDYLFSLENVVNKRFNINRGGSVIWEGDPYDAIIDITATYKLKTSLQPLTRTSSSYGEESDISTRVPINCDLILSERLSQPKINFNITAPTLEQSTQNIIQEAISTDEELNRQVLSLLVLNKFYTPSYNSASGNSSTVNSANLANTYTYELLSGQLSNLVSQMIEDVDVGISYRPEDEISSEQIEVALSTQIFNDRVTLNGNVEYGKYGKLSSTNANSSNIVGDFDLDVKLNKSGSLRAKAYTHSNDDFSFDNSPTTQGVGLSYQEEFDTVGELLRKYWNWFKGKGKKEDEITLEGQPGTINRKQPTAVSK